MAESVKRRVAAARLAVAFVAAGTIAGATAWAQAGPPPAPTAQSSAFDSFLKIDGIKGENIVDGSLLFKDFKKHQVPSYKQFQKVELSQRIFKKAILGRYYPKVEIDRLFIKGESTDYIKRSEISSYIKGSEADARYLKLSDEVVRGDGSVFTSSAVVGDQRVRLLDVPGLFTVDATWLTITITNTSGAPLTHTACVSGGQQISGGPLGQGEDLDCDGRDDVQTLQLIGTPPGGGPHVATLNFSSIPINPIPEDRQVTVQILIGM
jgi:hypothetical protein